MAEKVLFNVAGGILGSLASPLVAEEIRLLLGADGELEKFADTVSTIRAVLLDAEERQFQSHAVSLWLERLSDVLYEADDLLDAVSTEVRRREIMTQDKKAKEVRIFFSKSNQLAFRCKIGHKIKAIKERLDNIKADRHFHLEERIEETPPIMVTGRDDTYSFVPEQHVIGRKNDKEAVIKSLLDTNIEESLSILPIVGIGGLGKTTLAQLVYKDERLENFDIKMWVCVSDNFNVKLIVEKILDSAKVKAEGVQMEQLVDCLRKKVVAKKVFLVLDDVWNEDYEKWFELKKLLTNDVVGSEKKGPTQSKILVTTRSGEVARITHTIKPYILRGLREEESWDLFKKMAFNGEEPENSSIIKIGKEIVRKCRGVPLALGAMGRMLYSQNSVKEWEAFRDNQLSKNFEKTIVSILKLSYNILPSHLKHCFVYCSLFPKDYEFDETMLVRLWIAQGFVKLEENRLLEDIGHDYLMQLVSRLFFQKEVKSRCFQDDYSIVFKMHDLMHDLAISIAKSLIVTKLVDNKENGIQKAHHISFHSLNNVSSCYKESKTRTLICFKDREVYDQLDVEKVVSSFKLLRVLVLGENCFGLNNIDSLRHLRYLDLSGLLISELPNSVTRLINLETLILSRCKNLLKLPKGISKLVNLRHLDNSNCFRCHLPREIVQLTNLQTLGLFSNWESSSEHDLGFEEVIGLKSLRGMIKFYDEKSDIQGTVKILSGMIEFYDDRSDIQGTACYSETVVDPKVKSIFNVLKLKDKNCHNHSMRQIRMVEYITQSACSSRALTFLPTLTSLVVLTIEDVPGCIHLSTLCQLPSLEEVHLCGLDDLEYICYSDENQLSSITFFPSLKFLEINKCRCLRGWLWIDYNRMFNNSLMEYYPHPMFSCLDRMFNNSLMEYYPRPMFSCLSKLSIKSSLCLTFMPQFPNTLEDLSWDNEDGASQITFYQFAASLVTPLSKLKKLELFKFPGIETLPMEGLQHLTSLENLNIDSCGDLKSLCLGSLHLTALKCLILYDCEKLEFINDEDGGQRQGLTNLLTVYFASLPKLVSLPWCLQHATALVDLHIRYCGNLTNLPEWICNYESLKELKIVNCSRLTYLPEGVETLPSLHRIYIRRCRGIRNIVRPPGYYPPANPCPYPPCGSETS